jgi:serine/threonine-protein kinase
MRTIRNGLTGGRDTGPAGKALRAMLLRVSAAVAVGAVVAVGCSSKPSTESGVSTTTSPAPAVPVLDGTFRLDFDGSAQISGAGPTVDKIPPATFAFRSTCSDNGCVATGSEVQPETPDTAVGPVVLDYLDGHWLMVKMTETSCGTYGKLPRMTVWELTPQPDGTLSGNRLNARLGSPDCVQAFRLPMRATRIGDVGAGVEIADPAQETKRMPSPPESWRGRYATVLTFVGDGAEPPLTQYLSVSTLCVRNSGQCVSFVFSRVQGRQVVQPFAFTDNQWKLSYQSPVTPCPETGKSAPRILTTTYLMPASAPNPIASLTGNRSIEYTGDCKSVSNYNIAATRVGD